MASASAFEYAPAPESRSVVDIAPSYGLFIDGEFTEAADGKVFKTVSPSTEEVLSEVAQAGAEDVDRAVKAARRAFEKWSALPGSERAKYLFRIARIIQERSRELAVLETLDNGKPIKETRDADLPLVAAHFFYYAGWADKLDHMRLRREPPPLGVAGQVIPWNFPLLMLAWKIAPALATGNTVVLKPAETTPLSALFFADICRQAGLPKGVVNILPGYGDAGAALVEHPDVNKVAFTGSTAVGKAIARQVAGTDKKVTLELGGKGANIVFDDAPIDQAVEGVVTGIFFNQGQVCCAGSRLLVQESIHDELLDSLKRRLSTLRLGDPWTRTRTSARSTPPSSCPVSPRSSSRARPRVPSAGPRPVNSPPPATGSPRRSSRTSPRRTPSRATRSSARSCPSSPSGPPTRPSPRPTTPSTASPCGIWTEKGSRILAVASKLRAGVIWSNTFNKFDPTSPFGGYKESGFGREGGRHGLEAYLDV